MRAKAHVETNKNGRAKLVFTEFPYQVNKGMLQEKIAQLVNEKRIEGISDMRDESNRKGLRLVIELKQNAVPEVVLNNLYKHTSLQTTFGANNLALVNGVPKQLTLHQMLQYYIDHQVDVVTRRTQYDLAKARARAHILEGLLLALDNIDEVINIIRSSRTDAEASAAASSARFGFSEEQTTAILEMRLEAPHRLGARQDPGGARRPAPRHRVLRGPACEPAQEPRASSRRRCSRSSQRCATERLTEDLPRGHQGAQRRGPHRRRGHGGHHHPRRLCEAPARGHLPLAEPRRGKGMQGVNLKENDFVERIFVASTHEFVLFFSTKGKVYRLKVHELPLASRTARGTAIVNLLPLEEGEKILGGHRHPRLPRGRLLDVRHPQRHGEEDRHERVQPLASRRHHRHQPAR